MTPVLAVRGWRRIALLGVALVLLGGARQAEGRATIVVINRDRADEGFNDPTPVQPVGGNAGSTLGRQRLNVFERAAAIWSEIVDSSVEIRVGATFDPLECTAGRVTLGVAGPNNLFIDFEGAPRPATFYGDALADALAGTDLCPPERCADSDDVTAIFNSVLGTPSCTFPPWYMGLDGNAPENRPDLLTTVLHELGHGLGFLTFMDLSTGRGFMDADDAYMVNLEDHLIRKTFPQMSEAERVTAITATGDLHWVGPAVVAASGRLQQGRDPSGHVEMYAPGRLSRGGSVSHFSDFLLPDELMEPFDSGPILDVGLARELLQDIGWRLADGETPTPTPTPTATAQRSSTSTRRPTPTRIPTRTITRTPTRTRTRTPTVTGTPPTATPTPTPVSSDTCLGDCNGDDRVGTDELIVGVRIALGLAPMVLCGAFDVAQDGIVSIDDLVTALDHSLNQCPATSAAGLPHPSDR